MKSMLTKHEKLLIQRLKSPDTFKDFNRLGAGNTCCCLGHAGIILGCKFKSQKSDLNGIIDFDKSKIRFRSSVGLIDTSKITERGWKLLYKNKKSRDFYTKRNLHEFKKYVCGLRIVGLSFMILNDGSSYLDPVSHEDIAKFMEENPEASFEISS